MPTLQTEPSFVWRVQEQLAELGGQVRALEGDIARCKQAIRTLEAQQAVLNQYLTLLEEEDA